MFKVVNLNRENFDIACGHLQMRTRSVVLALLLITIAACAPIRQFEPAMGDAYMGAFLRGEVKLSCRIACFGTDGLNSAKRKALYDQARWQELVLLVIGIGYEQDLNYFYLGRAAEELGSPSAAKVYFKLSKMEKADDHCCVGSSCLGFQFPQDAEVRLSALTAAKPKDLSDPFAAPSAIAAVEPKQGDDPTTLRTLADQGDARAQWNLGVKYANGDGVTQDDAEALKWGRKAADQGNAFAQNGLGLIYLGGQGVAQNYAEAMTWFRKAADQGYASAQGNLGVMYYYGQGVPQNFIEAAKYLRLAADQGYPDAENWLGFLYGNGVPQDYVEAYKWYWT